MNEIEVEIPRSVFLPLYAPLIHHPVDVEILWGGRDSGKSHFIAQHLIAMCMGEQYFRCVLIKKTYESIRDSQYQTLKEIIDQWGLSNLFTTTVAPLGVTCVNGNSFLARGCDNPQKIKSIRNPSHAWYEEADQLDHEDYVVASSSLRSNESRVREYLSFNPESGGDYRHHWIFKTFFKDHEANMYDGTFASHIDVELPGSRKKARITYRSTHSTYHHNPYCTPERAAKLESYRESYPYYYDVFCLGRWGQRHNESPFLFNFDRAKHTGKTEWDSNHPLHVSFDFNKNPICCNVFQFIDGHLYGLESIVLPNSDIESLCDVIMSRYGDTLYIVTGDSSGWSRSALVKDDHNYYTAIKERMRLTDTQLWIYKNPRIEENQVDCNRFFATIPITLDQDKQQPLIFDCLMAEMTRQGTLRKDNRDDQAQQLDNLDTLRYLINALKNKNMCTL